MKRYDTVLLPAVISPSVLQLGQFVCNPLVPERDKYVPKKDTLKKIALADPTITKPFQVSTGLDDEGWFKIAVAHTFGAGLFRSWQTRLEITADEKIYTGFKDIDAALRAVCSDRDAKTWIADLAINKRPFYFVVGLEILKNAIFKEGVGDQGRVEASVTINVAPDPSLTLEGGISTGYGSGGFGFSKGGVNGIFAIKLLKCKWSFFRKEDMPQWQDKIHWIHSYEQIKGAAIDGQGIGLELEPFDIEELQEFRAETERLQTVSHDPDDE